MGYAQDVDVKVSDKTLLIIGIITGICGLLFAIMIFCGHRSLKTAIDVIDASADFTNKTKRIIGVSVLFFILQMIIVIAWLFCVASLWSWGDIEVESFKYQNKKTIFAEGKEQYFYYTLFFMIFGFVWIINLLNAQVNFITMYAASTYYFDSSSEKDGNSDVMSGVKAAFTSHIGSLAMGAFIISAVQVIEYTIIFMSE